MDDPASVAAHPRSEAGTRDGHTPPPDDEWDDDQPPAWADRLAEWRHRVGLDARALVWVGAVLVAALVAAWLLRPSPTPVEETIPTASSEGQGSDGSGTGGPTAAPQAASTPSTSPEVVVNAAGAVVRPGVYTLDPGARVDDLIKAAGGVSRDADLARVNLAAPLTDGSRVYVPRVGEEEPPVVGPDAGSPPPASGGEDGAPALVNINTAGVDELDELPGIGPSIAAAIVAYRTENGAFASVDDLLEVRGIGDAKLAEIRDLVTL